MPRQARIVIPSMPHHITQRGNYRQKVFDNKAGYVQYCKWMNKYALEYNMDILGYCLMENHVHFIVIPPEKKFLAKVFNTVHMRYAHYVNRQRGVKGHLWQGRFYSCILDEAHLYRAVRYVEMNPVRAKIVKEAWQYEWSSALDNAGEREQGLIKLSLRNKPVETRNWKEYLKENDQDLTDDMRLKTIQGLVVGTDSFINKLEKSLNRSLKCLKQGRPRKDS